MRRVYVSFTDEEYEVLATEAKKLGMAVSRYVAHNTLVELKLPLIPKDVKELYDEVDEYLIRLESGDNFFCAVTIENWNNLTKSQQMIVSKYLTKIVNENPDAYKLVKDSSDGHAKIYKKK